MRPIHVAMLNAGFPREVFDQMRKDFAKDFERAEDMCCTIERVKPGDLKGGIDALQQTWDAIKEANGYAPSEAILVAWAPAMRLLYDAMGALESLAAEHMASMASEYLRLQKEVDDFRATGVFPVSAKS